MNARLPRIIPGEVTSLAPNEPVDNVRERHRTTDGEALAVLDTESADDFEDLLALARNLLKA